ncbi:hypothetical protein GJAV_G00270280 [Gymnothorax javanicus]|nr:hypothetical protein GJAV_G00270280 [Gymnothorax javanicus]
MDETVILWLTSHYFLQVASVSCCRVPGSVEVRVEFGPFTPVQEADRYSLTIFSEENQTLWLDASDVAGCESDCSFVLHEPLQSEAFNVDLKSIKNDVVLETKSFRIDPELNSSLRVEATATSAFFSWRVKAGDHSCSLRLGSDLWIVPQHRTSFESGRKLNVLLETAQCPAGWVPSDSSCFRAWRRGRAWMEAGEACSSTAPGSHLADVEREEDFLFISTYLSALNHMVLVWTGLNDLLQEGQLQWSNGAAYSLNSTVTSSLPATETDCFALQMNATSPGYFFTGFFCYMPLPYLCHAPSPERFALTLLAVQDTEAMIGWNNVEEWWQTGGAPELILQYQEDGFRGQPRRRRVRPRSREETVRDLIPGRVYLFSLRAAHLSGAVQTLGSMLTVCSRPSAPQSLSVSKVTSTELAVQWSAANSSHDTLFHQYRLSWEDVASGLKRSMVVQKHITSAVIGGLEPYHAYTISVQTVTDRGVASRGGSALTVITAVSPPAGVFVYADDIREDGLTVLWDPPPGEGPDGYFVLVRAHTESAEPREFWVKDSLRFQLETLSPGRTYEIGVAAVKNSNRSEVKTVLHTLRPRPVTMALPYEVSSHRVALFVQRPAVGVLEGVTVRWEGGSHFQPLSDGEDRVTVEGLTAGTVYNFSVFCTSAGVDSTAYSVTAVKTCLVAPAGLREGEVTDSSVEILWDAPEGQGLSYEVICTDCSTAVQVQKVSEERVVFSGLGPGQLFNFSVRSEKEGFRDSTPVFRTFRTAPSTAEWLPHSKTCTSLTVCWSRPPGVIDGFILSISNDTYKMMKNFTASDLRMLCFEGLSPGSDYRIDLLSFSGEKMSVPATVNLSTVPGAPEDLTLVQQDDDSVFVSWRPPQGQVEGYQVAWQTGLTPLRYGASAMQETRRNLSATESSIGVQNLTPGAEYRFTLQSFRRAETSEPASKRILMRPPRLCRLSLTKVNTSSVGLAWDAAAGLFDHYRLTVANASATQEVFLPPEALSYTVSGLQDGCSYNLTMERVRGTVTGRAALLTVTTVPARPNALRVSSVSSHSFSLRWAGPSGCVDRYQVDLNPAQGQVTVRSVENGEIQADVLTLTPGVSYSTTVTAVASSGFSASVSRSITTEESIPDAPTDLRGKHMGFAGILVSWHAPDPANGDILSYTIKYKEVCPYPESSFNQITSDGTEQLFNRLTPGSVYNIKVAARNSAGLGAFSKSLFFKTAEASPGPVTNLTAFATNHSTVRVSWFLPKQTNGLITIFTVKVRHARTNTVVNELKLNAEDIMDGVLPHCNDAVDILSRGTPSPLEMSMQTASSSSPITQSAVPPAASWNIPIIITVDQLRPYTAYVFEVSAHTGENDGQIATSMVRMPESAPEDPPQNLTASDVTSKSFSLSWDPPTILTGRFSYVVELHGPTGYLFENATTDLKFMYSGLSPYTQYQVVARARSAGALGPEAQISVLTPAEAPSAVTGLVAEAVDATSVQVSWGSPSQPNGLITQYKILVLIRGMLIQNITLVGPEADLNEMDSGGAGVLSRRARDAGVGLLLRYRREAPTPLTDAPSESTSAYFLSAASASNRPSTATDGSAHPSSAFPITSGHSLSPAPDTTSSPSWLTDSTPHPTPRTAHDPQTRGVATLTLSSDSSPTGGAEGPSLRGSSPSQPRLSTRAAVNADVTSDVTAPTVDMVSSTEVIDVSADHISYVVTNLSPFTEYTFSVSAFTMVGEGPLSETQEKTREQVPSSVQNVTYQNISSSSILMSWEPPLNPNGKITHYTVYLLDLTTQEAFQRMTNETSLLLSELKKYNSYKLRVTASTTVGESDLSEEDNVFAVTMEDEPDSPPVNLTAYDVTATSATIAWSPPVLANGVIQFYQILFWNSTMSSEFNSTTPSLPVEGLRPFSFYNVSVRAFTRLGDGNQTSEVLELLSGEDVPGSPPYNLAYESLSSSEVNVSWAAPLTPNGAILFYNVEYWNSTHSLNATTPTTHTILSNLRKYANYRLFVRASTSQGSGNYTSDFLNVTTLEDVPSSPPRNLLARKVSDTQVELSWSPPLEANSEILYYVVSVWNVTSQQTQNVTTTSVILDVDKDSRYNASVSSWTRLGNGGIFLSIIINAFDAVPTDPPQNVSYVSLSPTSIQVKWSPPTQPNGIIQFYTIYYSDNSSVFTQRVNVSEEPPGGASSNYSFVIKDLAKGTEYSLWLSSSTDYGEGRARSDVVHISTMEDGTHLADEDRLYTLPAPIMSSSSAPGSMPRPSPPICDWWEEEEEKEEEWLFFSSVWNNAL